MGLLCPFKTNSAMAYYSTLLLMLLVLQARADADDKVECKVDDIKQQKSQALLQVKRRVDLSMATESLASTTTTIEVSTTTTQADACLGNEFPLLSSGTYNATGLPKFGDVFDQSQLAPLTGSDKWKLGDKWKFSVVATSSDTQDRMFGFAGGGGFLTFHVLAGATNKYISVTDMVRQTSTRLEYRGEGTTGAITFTGICLEKAKVEMSTSKEPCTLQELPSSNISVKSFANFSHGSAFEGLYVNKEAKFAFCLIEKNACSMWSAIMGRIENGNLDAGAKYGIAHKSFSPEDASLVFNDKSATRAVFVRDPLERFLSAFLNKCTVNDCANPYCHMRNTSQTGSPISFSVAVEWLRNKDVRTLGNGDGHWTSQSSHCELHSRLHEYTVLGVMEPTTLADNADCLLERAGLSSLNVKSRTDSGSFWQTPGHARSNTENVEYLKSFYTKDAAEEVYKAFEEDYKLFSIARPSWIGDAHGKFFTKRHAECKPSSSLMETGKISHEGSSDNSYGLEEIDDIPSLARNGGFLL